MTLRLFLERGISAAPVVDDQGTLVGIVNDLIHRSEIGTERRRPRGELFDEGRWLYGDHREVITSRAFIASLRSSGRAPGAERRVTPGGIRL